MRKNIFKYGLINILTLFFLGKLTDLTTKINGFLAKIYLQIWPSFNLAWFDHRFDYARGPQNVYWLERAIYAMREIKKESVILDIGCGDGMFDGLFYSQSSKRIDAIDVDPGAISFAENKYNHKNVRYHNSDAISWLGKGNKYDLIIMYVVIYHFNAITGQKVLKMVKKSLNKEGVLLGSTPIFKNRDHYNSEHKNIFLSETQVKIFLSKVFGKVTIFTSEWPDGRTECYFRCSI